MQKVDHTCETKSQVVLIQRNFYLADGAGALGVEKQEGLGCLCVLI